MCLRAFFIRGQNMSPAQTHAYLTGLADTGAVIRARPFFRRTVYGVRLPFAVRYVEYTFPSQDGTLSVPFVCGTVPGFREFGEK